MAHGHPGRTVNLADGRTLGYAEAGDPGGRPLFHFHGHPGSRLEVALAHERAAAAGVRLIGVDRPGVGLSDFQPGRRLLDWPDDVGELADSLAIERFAVEGISGGAPYALATAHKLGERLTACGLLSGLGPLHELGTAGMMAVNRLEFFLARWLPGLVRFLLWLLVGRLSRQPGEAAERRLEALAARAIATFPEADRKVLAAPEPRRLYLRALLEAFRQGCLGPASDARLYVRPWGFRLEEIAGDRIHLWHGELDRHVPVAMARAVAAALPGCRATFYPEDGHLSASLCHLDEILAELTG